MQMRDILAYFAYKYGGDCFKIIEAIENKEQVTKEQIQAFHNMRKYDFISIVDENYPEILKHVDNPPIVMFCKGDPSLINHDSEIIAKESDEGIRMIHAYNVEFTNKGICMNCVMACECHDDMDMLVEQVEHAQESLKRLLTVFKAKETKEKGMER